MKLSNVYSKYIIKYSFKALHLNKSDFLSTNIFIIFEITAVRKNQI